MANISALSAAEMIALSEGTGFAQWEFEQFWTQESFDAFSSNFRAGLIIEPVVPIEQAGIPPSEVFLATFVEGVKEDLGKLFEAIPTLKELGTLTKLLVAAAVITGGIILITKVKG